MALLNTLGRITKKAIRSGAAAPLALGVAVGLGVHSSIKDTWDPNDPNKPSVFNTLKEGALDVAMGDPYADWNLTGFSYNPVDAFPILQSFAPAPIADYGRAMDAAKSAYDQPQYGGLQRMLTGMQYGDRLNRWYMNQAAANVKRGYTATDYGDQSSLPYGRLYSSQARTNIDYGSTPTGDMVFGMYNLRQR